MRQTDIAGHIIRTLLYYEIFDHPLSAQELFYLFPRNSLSLGTVRQALDECTHDGRISTSGGYYYLPKAGDLAAIREEREHRAAKRLRIARFMTGIIRRFPFVRGVFLSGDLSKGVAVPASDIDYVIITAPGRLWICRSLLVLFKKTVLLNSKKYFCLNYYVDAEHLSVPERNYYTATEIAHLKPLHNQELFLRYMNANAWITEYFPNFRIHGLTPSEARSGGSFVRSALEMFFRGGWAARLDKHLMQMMINIWVKRYPAVDNETRSVIFRSNEYESRAYIGDFSARVVALYDKKVGGYHETGDPQVPALAGIR